MHAEIYWPVVRRHHNHFLLQEHIRYSKVYDQQHVSLTLVVYMGLYRLLRFIHTGCGDVRRDAWHRRSTRSIVRRRNATHCIRFTGVYRYYRPKRFARKKLVVIYQIVPVSTTIAVTVTVSLLEIAVKDRIARQSDKQYKLQKYIC